MTPAEYEQHLQRSQALALRINEVINGSEHRDVLCALSTLLRFVAKHHPCCAADVHHHATTIANEQLVHLRPQGEQVH